MKQNIIAVDFDGTLCENKWPEIGMPNEELIEYLKKRQANGEKLILWTSRNEEQTKEAVEWCKKYGLIFDAVNDNLPEIMEAFGGNCRKIFANEYIDDRNRSIGSCREKSSMERWAENEVAIACRREKPDGELDYGCACYESALKAFSSLCEDGHSGFSIGLTKAILNRLIDNKPLLPIEDTDEVWSDIFDMSGLKGEEYNHQCKRMSSLFKYVYADGTVKYRDVDRYHGVNINCPDAQYHSELIDTVMDELYPITMPYMPADRAYKIYTEDFLVDPAKGDFDTVGILYVITPSMERLQSTDILKKLRTALLKSMKRSTRRERKLRKLGWRQPMDRNRFIQCMKSNIVLSDKERQRIIRKSVESQPWKLKCTIAMEEFAELTQAISKQIRGYDNRIGLLEEMADAYICLEFLKSIFDITPEELQKAMDVKLQRERNKPR